MAQIAITSLAAQEQAAEAEGIFVPTAEDVALVRRYRELQRRIDAATTEQKAIVKSLQASMNARDAEKLALDGKNVAQWIAVSSREVDIEALKATNPGVVAAFEQAKTAFEQESVKHVITRVREHARFVVK